MTAPWALERGFAFQPGQVNGPTAVFEVNEYEQGSDLDGDGIIAGSVHVVHEFSNGHSSILTWPLEQAVTTAGHCLALRHEALEGADWTGDGATDDFALFSIDARTGVETNHGVGLLVENGQGILAFHDDLVPLRVREDGVDLNGDGDTTDLVLHLLEL